MRLRAHRRRFDEPDEPDEADIAHADVTTKSWARLDADLTSPDKLVLRQLGLARFGMTMATDTQTVWLDDPSAIVRAFTLTG